jgi:PLP dependent protein
MDKNSMEKIRQKLLNVQNEIQLALDRSGRQNERVTLVVVTKTQPAEVNRFLYELGVRDFGENRLDSAIGKMESLKGLDGVTWHMIGNLQSRKARDMVKNFGYFHGLDRLKIARKLNTIQASVNIPCLLQFNVSGEASKSGWLANIEENWQDLDPDIEEILALPNIDIQGLMMMAPYNSDVEELKIYFGRLKDLQHYFKKKFPQGNWEHLSMGMSNDYVSAIEEGATIVRVGTAIVG